MSLPEENGSCNAALNGREKCQRALFEQEGCHVVFQGEALRGEAGAQPDAPQLPIDRIGIGKLRRFAPDCDLLARSRDRKLDLQLNPPALS
jgi:hypothetical protein